MTMVRVPVSLLLDPELTPSAKVLWMALRLRSPAGPARAASLRARSGLARPTVRDGLARLTTAGWYAAAAGEAIDRAPADAQVTVPGDLLADRSGGALGKVLYGVLQKTPQFRCCDTLITTGTSLHREGMRRSGREGTRAWSALVGCLLRVQAARPTPPLRHRGGYTLSRLHPSIGQPACNERLSSRSNNLHRNRNLDLHPAADPGFQTPSA